MTKSQIAISLLLAAVASAHTAKAEVLDVAFLGVVQSQIGTGAALNSPVNGYFFYDTTLSAFTKFVIGGESAAAGFASQADLSPDHYTALYTAQLSPVAVGGDVNSTFSVDLEAKNSPWSALSAATLLSSAELTTNLDTAASSFTYYNANSNGSNVKMLTATLTSVQVSAVPEPTSAVLMLAGIAVAGLVARRRAI